MPARPPQGGGVLRAGMGRASAPLSTPRRRPKSARRELSARAPRSNRAQADGAEARSRTRQAPGARAPFSAGEVRRLTSEAVESGARVATSRMSRESARAPRGSDEVAVLRHIASAASIDRALHLRPLRAQVQRSASGGYPQVIHRS